MIFLKSNFQLTLQPTWGAVKTGNSFVTLYDVVSCFAAPGYFSKRMRNNFENSITDKVAGKLTNDARKALKPIYYIDQVEVSGDNVAVDYTLNDNWLFINLSHSELKQFSLNRSLNDYIFDYMHGEHVQDAGSFDIDTFMSENLEDVVKVYLQSNPLESVNVQMEALKANISKRKLSTINA